MRSARRRALIEKKKKTIKFSGLLYKVFIPAILILAIFAFFKFGSKYWNGEDKFTYAYRLENGDDAISILDPKLSELTTLIIPGDTEVEVARNYGELRIKNVWQLGVNEKIGGNLLAGTITQNFLFPVFLWSDGDIRALAEGNLLGTLRFIFFPKSTSITFGDRVSAGIFAMQINNSNKNLLDLGKNQFLVKQKLNDGEAGYVINGDMSPRLTVYFADNNFADKNLRVSIADSTNEAGVADKVGQIIEIMGGKIVSIDKKSGANTDCTVFGSNTKAVRIIAAIFSCKISHDKGNFDLEIDLGSAFAKRF